MNVANLNGYIIWNQTTGQYEFTKVKALIDESTTTPPFTYIASVENGKLKRVNLDFVNSLYRQSEREDLQACLDDAIAAEAADTTTE